MAATATVQEANGTGPSYTTITNSRFKCADNATQDTNDPTKILGSINYSYWKHICLQFTGTFTSIDNIRMYSDGTITWTYGTAGEVRIGHRDSDPIGCPVGNYDQPTGPGTGQGYDLEVTGANGHAWYNAQTNKSDPITDYTSSATALIDNSTYTTVNDRCYFAVLQLKVDTNATQGYQSTETLTWLYDEV